MNKYKINQLTNGYVQFELFYSSSYTSGKKLLSIIIEENDIGNFIELLEDFGFEKVVEDE